MSAHHSGHRRPLSAWQVLAPAWTGPRSAPATTATAADDDPAGIATYSQTGATAGMAISYLKSRRP
jgi:hypothetical protein